MRGDNEEENQDFEYETINERPIFTYSFFARYNNKYVKLKEELLRDDDITNKYYNPEIAKYITYKLMSVVPM